MIGKLIVFGVKVRPFYFWYSELMVKNGAKIEILGGWWWISLGVVGMVLMGWSLWEGRKKEEVKVEYITAEEEDRVYLWIDVGGAVERPGVYEVEQGSRVKDGLIAAGGLADEADRDYVSRVINLASEVEDGEKIYIPLIKEQEGGGVVMGVVTDVVNLNTASKSQLDTLWGVGEKRAEDIINGRPYRSVEELVEKGVLTESVMEKNKDKLTVY